MIAKATRSFKNSFNKLDGLQQKKAKTYIRLLKERVEKAYDISDVINMPYTNFHFEIDESESILDILAKRCPSCVMYKVSIDNFIVYIIVLKRLCGFIYVCLANDPRLFHSIQETEAPKQIENGVGEFKPQT